MPKTIQIRDLDDSHYAILVRRAAEHSVTVPEFLRSEISRIVARPSTEEWLARTRRQTSAISRDDIQRGLDAQREDAA